jgi:hypothetical protein
MRMDAAVEKGITEIEDLPSGASTGETRLVLALLSTRRIVLTPSGTGTSTGKPERDELWLGQLNA